MKTLTKVCQNLDRFIRWSRKSFLAHQHIWEKPTELLQADPCRTFCTLCGAAGHTVHSWKRPKERLTDRCVKICSACGLERRTHHEWSNTKPQENTMMMYCCYCRVEQRFIVCPACQGSGNGPTGHNEERSYDGASWTEWVFDPCDSCRPNGDNYTQWPYDHRGDHTLAHALRGWIRDPSAPWAEDVWPGCFEEVEDDCKLDGSLREEHNVALKIAVFTAVLLSTVSSCWWALSVLSAVNG